MAFRQKKGVKLKKGEREKSSKNMVAINSNVVGSRSVRKKTPMTVPSSARPKLSDETLQES